MSPETPLPAGLPAATPASTTGGANAAATATRAAVAGKRHLITAISISVTGQNASTTWAVKDGSTTIWTGHLGALIAGSIPESNHAEQFNPPIQGSVGNAVSITATAPGDGCVATVNIASYTGE